VNVPNARLKVFLLVARLTKMPDRDPALMLYIMLLRKQGILATS
jgi:hypothetical protein